SAAVHGSGRGGPAASIGGFSVVTRDALPFIKTVGHRNEANICGINTVGLERKGFTRETIEELKRAYRLLFRSQLNTSDALRRVREETWSTPEVALLVEFIDSATRGFVR